MKEEDYQIVIETFEQELIGEAQSLVQKLNYDIENNRLADGENLGILLFTIGSVRGRMKELAHTLTYLRNFSGEICKKTNTD